MNLTKFLRRISGILTALLLCNDAGTMPASSFIIEPSGINHTVYSSTVTVYSIESSDEDFTLSATASQKVLSVKSDNGKSSVTISAGDNLLTENKNPESFLKNTPYLNLNSDSVKRASAKFRNAKDPLRDVSRFVNSYITDKKIGIPLVPADSILKNRSGDCTEHSVLTIAILRELKIPSRAVMGLILTESFLGKRNVFVYHMWVEAYIGGRWVLVDSTRPESIHPNRYIALAYHNLMTETPLEYLQAISTMQNMKIYYIK